jgi:hypothetical protein
MGSFSPTFYAQLLCSKIPKEQKKKTDSLTVFLVLSVSARVKALHKLVMKLTPVVLELL